MAISTLFQPGRAGFRLLAIAAILPFLASGCYSTKKAGSHMIGASHGNYNEVVSCVIQKELLLNLVRRRYLEPLQFTSLGSITQSQSVTKGVSGNLNFGLGRTGGVAANGSVADFPTYSLTPQSGPESYKALHDQVSIDVISQLANAGYPLEMIFTLLAQEVSGIRGVAIGTGGRIHGGSKNFVSVLLAMEHLESQNKVDIADVLWEEKLFEHPFAPEVFSPENIASVQEGDHTYTSTDDGQSFYVTSRTPQPVLWIAEDVRGYGPGRELLQLLQLDPNPGKKGWALRNQKFVQGVEFADLPGKKQDHLAVQTRSLYGVMNQLSLGVRVPPCDEGTATFCLAEYQKAVAKGLAPDIASKFKVHCCDECPPNAYVAVPHGCKWFYIDCKDLSSKTYFNALFDLFNLAGPERIESGNEDRISSPVLSF